MVGYTRKDANVVGYVTASQTLLLVCDDFKVLDFGPLLSEVRCRPIALSKTIL